MCSSDLVRVPSKVPRTRMFHFHGVLFQLHFEIEEDTIVDAKKMDTVLTVKGRTKEMKVVVE